MLHFHLLAAAALLVSADETPAARTDFSIVLPKESDPQHTARHAAVAKAREGTILLAHRGAATFAPENSIDAIDAAMQIGCRAVKLDFRRTLDGVVVLYHDDRLENRLNIFGTVETSYYDELKLASLRDAAWGIDRSGDLFPTLDEVLAELRRRIALVYIDVKTPGLSDTLLDAFRKVDMLDHVIGYGVDNSEAFQKAGIKQIAFKGSLLETHQDLDPERIKTVLARPGQVVFLDDPRAALTQLGYDAKLYIPSEVNNKRNPCYPLPATYPLPALDEYERVLVGRSTKFPLRMAAARIVLGYGSYAAAPLLRAAPQLLHSPQAETRRVIAWSLGMFARNDWQDKLHGVMQQWLLDLLNDSDPTVRAEAAVACARARLEKAGPAIIRLLQENLREKPRTPAERGALILARGQYAYALGLLGLQMRKNYEGELGKEAGDVLLRSFCQRETGHNRMWLGIDGAMAAWSLGKLKVAAAVPQFREVLLWQPPPGVEAADDDEPPQAFVYWDLQAPRFLPRALLEIGTTETIYVAEKGVGREAGKIGAPEALAVLREILKLPPDRVSRGSPELLVRTAAAVLNLDQESQPKIVAELLSNPAPQIRGEAILQCLREPHREYRKLLEAHSAWAVPWWSAEYGEGFER